MDSRQASGLRSTAAIAGHPLHPLLVTFPIAFLVGALLSDLAYQATGDVFWARASIWLIGAGLAFGVLAALTGLIDFVGSDRIRSLSLAWYHFIGNALALILSAISFYLRFFDEAAVVTVTELLLSILVVVIFAVTGWLGGEMVFRHGAGMMGEDHTHVGPRERSEALRE
jgi:uncharacterized membrane protein